MSSTEVSSAVLSIGVAGVALLLWAWQRWERNRREALSLPEDVKHFRRQDARRTIVAAIMAVLATGIYVGSRIATRVDGRPNLLFVWIWIGIFCLVLMLLVLAMIDWVATRRYAIRHRSAMLQQGIELRKEELRARAARSAEARDMGNRNGHLGHPTLEP